MEAFDFIGPSDKPALLAISTGEWRDEAMAALQELGYKVHTVDNHTLMMGRFNQVNYQVIIMEEMFAGSAPGENESLIAIQRMSMNLRRHATILLIGDQFETLNALQAFAHSVHCVVNYSEMKLIGQLIQKSIADNDTFLTTYRELQKRIFTEKIV